MFEAKKNENSHKVFLTATYLCHCKDNLGQQGTLSNIIMEPSVCVCYVSTGASENRQTRANISRRLPASYKQRYTVHSTEW